MTITRDYVVVNLAAPDMSRLAFVASLDGTPAATTAYEAYNRIWERRGSHAFCRSVYTHESSDGTKGIYVKYQTHSPGNTRSVRNGRGTVFSSNVVQTINGVDVPPSNQGEYARYPTEPDGWDDLIWRITDPEYVYAQEGRTTIGTVIPRFAPKTDNNDPERYIAAVVAQMNQLVEDAPVPPPPSRVIRVALSSGHHNTSGGNALEIKQTGPLTVAIARACRNRGFDVRVVQGHDGLDMFPGSLSDVAKTVVNWDATWPVDVFLETHTEGAGGARGAFAIYPDWSPDIDTDVRDTLGPHIAQLLTLYTGMPQRRIGNVLGVMSERQTGVGSQGNRLGVFRVTEPIRDHCTRLIVEFGAHDNAADLAIFNAPGFLDKAAAAVADAIASFYGVTEPQPPPSDEFWLPGAKFPFVRGFAGYVQRIGAIVYPPNPALGALSHFGLPMEAEYEGIDGNAYQRTERYVLQWQPGVAPPFDIIGLIRGHKIPERKAA